jgi:hypothetical protein
VNYDAEIAKLVDLYSEKMSRVTGKPEHRKQGARKLLIEITDAVKRLVREQTLEFYERKPEANPAALGPLFAGSDGVRVIRSITGPDQRVIS